MKADDALNKKNGSNGSSTTEQKIVEVTKPEEKKEVAPESSKPPEPPKPIPKVLEERLLLTPEHRKVLSAMDKLSPVDTGWVYLPGNALDRYVPTEGMIAQEVGMDSKKVLEAIQDIKKIWKIPDALPTNNGRLSQSDALIHALTNQHRLRWDKEIGDYRIPRIHVYNGELGTGKLYTNNEAFEGERIFRNAMDLNDRLNSYHLQGGVMPDIVAMFGKLKNQRALLTGLNKTGKLASASELEKLKNQLELAQGKPLDAKAISNLRRFVINTIDSFEEAARSVAYELVPLVKDIPEHVPIHMYFSFSDDANLSELEDLLISAMRRIHEKASAAQKNLPDLRTSLSGYKLKLAKRIVSLGVANYLLESLSDKIPPTGKELREWLNGYLEEDKDADKDKDASKEKEAGKALVKKLYTSLKKKYFKQMGREDEDGFARAVDDAKTRYTTTTIKALSDIDSRRKNDIENKESLEQKLEEAEDEIAELEQYEKALMAEKQEKHAWFTKKIAIKPTEAKANLMIEKIQYTAFYHDILIPELKKLVGRELQIYLHSDREKSVFIKDPTALLGMNDYPSNKLYGTIFYSIPRPNRQRSNEPLLDSLKEVEKKHEGAIKTMIKRRTQKPKNVEQFDKRQSAAFANVVMTSWGADGYRLQPKFVIAPTEVRGEFQLNPEIVWYLKLPTRYDADELTELKHKGNRGTWEIKRLDKGGPTAGNVIQTVHPDQSQEWMFVDDLYYASIAAKYSAKVSELEEKIARARKEEIKQQYRGELDKLYAEIRPQINYALLANDLHLGAFNLQGRPTNVDYIRSSQLVALQDLGLDNIKIMFQSEALHGKMKIRSHGYDSTMEGQIEDPITFKMKHDALKKKLKEQGMSDKKIIEHLLAYTDEQMDSRAVFRAHDQKEMFKLFQYPFNIELMDKGAIVAEGPGNHWQQSMHTDEAREIRELFDLRYVYTGKLLCSDTGYGQSYSFDRIILPGTNAGVTMKAMFTHKMWHGSTEISALADQAIGHKEDVFLYITADRHHPGAVAEKDVYAVLDVGKQTTMAFVPKIGKAPSVRGTMAVGYGSNAELILPVRFWLDPIVEKIIGWEDKAEMLKTSWEGVKTEMNDYYTKHKY